MKYTKAQKMLLGVAMGDAFGRPYEGMSREEILSKFTLKEYKRGEKYKPFYTDDTQMTLGVAETMLSNFDFSEECLGSHFIYAYKRDKRSGYSAKTQAILEKAYCGKDFLYEYDKLNASYGGAKATGNGNVMRCLPIGLFSKISDVIKYAKINSEMTHGHPDAINACIALSLAAHALYYNKCQANHIISFILKYMRNAPYKFKKYLSDINALKTTDYSVILGKHANTGLPVNALMTVGIVLYILKNYHDAPVDALKQAIVVGGDVDSSGSLVLGLVLINNPLSSIPNFLFDDLDNRKYGKDYIIELGEELSERYKENDNNPTEI